jgi:hypothetical protein
MRRRAPFTTTCAAAFVGRQGRLPVAVALLAATLVATDAGARRVPSAGGKVVVSVPEDLIEAAAEAHIYVPMIERVHPRSVRDALAHPALPGLPGWRSTVLVDAVASPDKSEWILTAPGPAGGMGASLGSCFATDGRGRWPGVVLRAAGIDIDVSVVRDTVTLRFSKPVGAVPELLEGCMLRGATGQYSRTGRLQLDARDGHVLGPPSMRRIELRPPGQPADLVADPPLTPGVGTLLAPFPDVLLLLQPKNLREKDPLDLTSDEGALPSFRTELRADLLVNIFWAGRGGPALGILPPGLAPARPLPEPTAPGRPLPLTLNTLSSAAERISIVRDGDDILADGVVERIAVLLRTRGFGTQPLAPGVSTAGDALRVLRWRPPTSDPALALLVLVGTYPEIADAVTLDGVKLLSDDADARLQVAMTLERELIAGRAAVPLLVAERWFGFNADLRGVRVRPDGVPLLDQAFWGGNP